MSFRLRGPSLSLSARGKKIDLLRPTPHRRTTVTFTAPPFTAFSRAKKNVFTLPFALLHPRKVVSPLSLLNIRFSAIAHIFFPPQVRRNRRHFVTTSRLRAACFLNLRAMLQSDYNFRFSLCCDESSIPTLSIAALCFPRLSGSVPIIGYKMRMQGFLLLITKPFVVPSLRRLSPRMAALDSKKGKVMKSRPRRKICVAALVFAAAGIILPPAARSQGDSQSHPPVSKSDVAIVQKARHILDSPQKWNRADNRNCPNTETTFSLYCTLETATFVVTGDFAHRGATMQEARFFSPDPKAAYRKQMERANCGFDKLEILPGNIGYVKFDFFADPSVCAPTVIAAMNFLANTDAIIFDLRENGGGDPEMVTYICSYLFDQPTHLNDLWTRKGNTTQQFWTLPYVSGKRLATQPAYVLTSHRTFSGGEEFTYDLQQQKRATIVGEVTGGGAHPVAGHRINDHFEIGVPFATAVNPITHTSWEGTGITPDVKAPAASALSTAISLVTQKLTSSNKSSSSQ